ncbi:DUF397 domain-containing protein [Actinacidiphila alni]|uniref:DUF397 domain-containing protein n=1 Tax=Actinacidiphila alni TaxID=380248 RepID=UPI0034562AAF
MTSLLAPRHLGPYDLADAVASAEPPPAPGESVHQGPALAFSVDAWSAFVAAVKADRFTV